MIKEAVKIGKAKFEQRQTPVTNNGLLEFGFRHDDLRFQMGDLIITLIEGYHYYMHPSGKLTRLKNVYEVSKLVYGKTPYLPV